MFDPDWPFDGLQTVALLTNSGMSHNQLLTGNKHICATLGNRVFSAEKDCQVYLDKDDGNTDVKKYWLVNKEKKGDSSLVPTRPALWNL